MVSSSLVLLLALITIFQFANVILANVACGERCSGKGGGLLECETVTCGTGQSCSQKATCNLSADKTTCSTRGAMCLEPTAVARIGLINRVQDARNKKLAVIYALEKNGKFDSTKRFDQSEKRPAPVEAPMRF